MNELLRKYYEYFLKLDIEDINSFKKLYNLIINKYDINDNENLTKDFYAFQRLFKDSNKDSVMSLNIRKKKFERKNVSFDFFDFPEHLSIDTRGNIENSFIHTQTHSKNVICKAYISIKPESYVKTVLKLIEFVDYLFLEYKEDNIGNCKFRKIPANDAAVFRLTSLEQLNDLMDFINENKLRDILGLSNPFIPSINGVGIMIDNGKSYNKFVASALWNYMNDCRSQNRDVNIYDFIEFIKTNDIKVPFINEEVATDDYKDVLVSKLSNVSDNEIIENFFRDLELHDAVKHNK